MKFATTLNHKDELADNNCPNEIHEQAILISNR